MPMAFRLASIFAIAGFCVGRQGRESRWCGSIYFTAPGMRMALEGRNVESSPVFRVAPDGSRVMATTECEYPNGLAFSP
jgi:sugar lactone lactonase YvrE